MFRTDRCAVKPGFELSIGKIMSAPLRRTALILSSIFFFAGLSAASAQVFPNPGTPALTIAAFDALFAGPHGGARAVHARGLLLEGSFIPSPRAAELTRAVHLNGGPVSVLVRFSNFAAIPGLHEGAPEASPRGVAVRFLLPDGGNTDLVLHSYDGFPAATPEEFLDFLRAATSPVTLEAFASTHLPARTFLNAPKPTPTSYATEAYFGVNAFRFTNTAGQSRYARYRLIPMSGQNYLSPADAAARAPDFLSRELAERLTISPVNFALRAQLADPTDNVADGSVAWPAERPTLELGTITLRALAPDNDTAQRTLRFVPTNLVGGIAPSPDPMLLARTQAYRISADRRGSEP